MYFSHFAVVKMAKGKHAPAPGAVRKDKVIHPKSRKAAKMHHKEYRKIKVNSQLKTGGAKLQAVGEKLNWFKENFDICLDSSESDVVDKKFMLRLAEAFLSRFNEEVEQIRLKRSIGHRGNQNQKQHRSRLDVIELTQKTEREEFDGCGLEMPDLLDEENLKRFQDWEGELRFVQNIKLKRFKRSFLGSEDTDEDEMDCA